MATRGLSAARAATVLADEGRNEVPPPKPPSLWIRIGRQLIEPLIILLLAAAVVTAILGDAGDTAVIVLVVLVNTSIGVAQEVRADKAITALHQLASPTARVYRDGTQRTIPAPEVVRGDLIVLAQGDIVPADAALVEAQQLRLDEAALTGESLPVSRAEGEEVHAGTAVLAGRGLATVVRTGVYSGLGRIATLVASARPGPTLLQRRLATLGRQLAILVVALSAVVMVLGILSGRPVVDMAITGVSLAVAAVPESLPAVVTLALALGALRMARGHAIARRLHAVETLGSVTVLASDKTGTLTEGRMAVDRAVTTGGIGYRAYGHGYDPAGTVRPVLAGDASSPSPAELATAAALCNDAHLTPPTVDSAGWTAAGDPIEAALLVFAARCDVDVSAERRRRPRVAEEPFDAEKRRMTTVHSVVDGEVYVVCKGAPETILDPAVSSATDDQRDLLHRAARELADAGLRVLAVAAGTRRTAADALPPRGLRPLGLVGIGDPLREGAAGVAADLEAAGIRLVMITGDHPATAAAIAGRVGIWRDGDIVVRGDRELPEQVGHVRVFARTHPEQKLDIISALQAQGHVVAMTGDGVNDAPALRRCDIGVAMGAGGTEVARQAADLVLTDDNLATVVLAVREGRRIYDNIRRFLRYGLAGGAAEIAVMLLGPVLGLPIPLLPGQILWVNLLTHGLPGVALGAEPAEPDAMRRPPRPPQESILGRGLAASALGIGALIAATVLAVATTANRAGAPWQSMGFVTLGLAQLGVALAVRVPRRAGQARNPALEGAVVLSAILQVAAVLVGPLRELLSTEALSLPQIAVCAAVSTVPGLVVALVEAVRRHRWSGKGPFGLCHRIVDRVRRYT